MKNPGIALLALLSLVPTQVYAADLDVTEMVAGVRQALDQIEKSAPKDSKLQVNEVEFEISVIVRTEVGGGFKLYVVTADGKYSSEQIQRFKYKLGPMPGKRLRAGKYPSIDFGMQGMESGYDPAWTWGRRNASGPILGVDAKENKMFIFDEKSGIVVPVLFTTETKFWDFHGKILPMAAVRAGKTATVIDEIDPKTGWKKPSLVIIQPAQTLPEQ